MKYIYNSGGASRKFTDAMKNAFSDHFDKLEKFLAEDEPVKVTLDKEGNVFILKCQVVANNNKRVRTEFRGDDYYQLVDSSYDAIKKQLKKKREKSYWKERVVRETADLVEDEPLFKRMKHFILDPIHAEEAVDEMESLGSSWYAFRDTDNNDKISVVYRRFDYSFGK